jgi:hypothetical protein
MNFAELSSIAQISSGSAVLRGGSDSRAIMVGDLDGSGQLGRELTKVGSPASGAGSALRFGDIVISLRGNSNNAAVVDKDDIADIPLFATLDLAILRLNDLECVSPHFVATWLNLPATQSNLSESREGTAAKRLPLGPLKALQIPLPSWQRQSAIVALAREVADERRVASRIAQLRTTLFNACLAEAAMKESAL